MEYTHEQYTLTLTDTGNRTYYAHKAQVGYNLSDNKSTIFSGDDFYPAPSFDPEGPKSAEALLSFLTLCDGDTDDEYFENYTERQIDFRDSEAEDLYYWQEELNPEMYGGE